MKIIFAILVALCVSTYWTNAQTASLSRSASSVNPGQTAPSDTPYAVTERGANHRVWQRTTYETRPDGRQIPHIHKYNELATGMCFQQNGQWVDSKEEINILPDGTAAATQGQHQVYFPSDIYQGVIELVTPDSIHLQSRPLGLSYDDGSDTVLIAELKDSVGQLVGPNQVIYPDAFTDFKADLRYTYTKAGFEQDIVLQEQLPAPEAYGLNPQTARLQVLTEFFNAPEPVKARPTANRQNNLDDTTLTFGKMTMIGGKAFSAGDPAQKSARSKGIPVAKSWQHLSGRTFLVEELPVQTIEPQLEQLPVPANAGHAMNPPNSTRHKVSAARLLPPARVVQVSANRVQLAKADFSREREVVLDYATINSGETNYTFQGDTTYYISGPIFLSGTNTIEGGTVIKNPDPNADPSNADPVIVGATDPNACIVSKAQPYRMAVLTSMNDNSIGETIADSTGNPTETGVVYLYLYPNLSASTLAYLRFLYADTAIVQWSNGATNFNPVWNCQFINCGNAIEDVPYNHTPTYQGLYNVLISNCGTGVTSVSGQLAINGVNVTADQVNEFLVTWSGDAYAINYSSLTNSILTGVQHQIYLVDQPNVVLTLSNTACFVSSSNGIYQTVGAGCHYLATNSPYRNAGTTNIDPVLLADLATKTTYPPMVYSNVPISVATTFSPQAQRDTDAPDLGYHYDPLDYVFGGVDLYSNLTVTAGTAVGYYADYGNVDSSGQPYGISLNDGANFTSIGTATSPCWIVRYNTVQEGGNGNWTATGWMGGIMFNGSGSGITPQLNGRFTKWASAPGGGGFFRDNLAYGVGSFSDCEFYGNGITSYRPSLYFTNCLFSRVFTVFWDQMDAANLTFQNCTFYEGVLAMARDSWQSPSFWTVRNSAFDGTAFSWGDNFNGDAAHTAFDYNAYNSANTNWQTYPFPYPPNYGTLEVVGPHDVIVTNGYNWQSNWLGNYYLPTNSPLIDMGNTNANLLGLYYFTTQTNQILETNSPVDIGYHYMAVDANGNPVDNDGDGVPDWEDANPNDPNVGILIITIDSPANGSVVQ